MKQRPYGFKSGTELKKFLHTFLTKPERRCKCGNMLIEKYRDRDTIFAYFDLCQGKLICYNCHEHYSIKEFLLKCPVNYKEWLRGIKNVNNNRTQIPLPSL